MSLNFNLASKDSGKLFKDNGSVIRDYSQSKYFAESRVKKSVSICLFLPGVFMYLLQMFDCSSGCHIQLAFEFKPQTKHG